MNVRDSYLPSWQHELMVPTTIKKNFLALRYQSILPHEVPQEQTPHQQLQTLKVKL